jgi:outer membrane lipoprotein-sorting protein
MREMASLHTRWAAESTGQSFAPVGPDCKLQRPLHLKGLGRRLALWVALALGYAHLAAGAELGPLLDQWIAAQTNLHTWSADAVQTRSIKTLSEPLVSTGKVWVVVPDRFRWELGQPAQTIALRRPDQLFLIYPKLKRVEKYALDAKQPGPMRDALALLEASFPRSRADLEARFRVLSMTQTNAVVHLLLQPKSASARKFVSGLEVAFSVNGFSPVSTELRFSDGSSMRNDFSHAVVNQPLDEGLFDVKLGPGFTVVEPLRQ